MEANMFLQIVSYLLYAIAGILFVHLVNKIRIKGLSISQTLDALSIAILIISAINVPRSTRLVDISGSWYGIGNTQTPNGVFNEEMSLTISSDCEEGKVCGQAFFPSVSCSFSLEYLGERDGRFYFDEVNKSAGCGIATETYFETIGNNKIKYYAKGDWGETNIILEHR
jgi:hypothetical protein